jgi:hypothetical protein
MQAVSEEASRESRLLAVSSLASLPLFQLSTAGMELFHTNMLYWLATERPDQSISVWNALGLPAARVPNQAPFIKREWRHHDLVVSPGDGLSALVVENKIGAIPNPAQLDGYHAAIQSARPPFDPESAEYVLLTLTPPSFALPSPWRSVTYSDLLSALRKTATRLTDADASLVEAYADLVDQLNAVATAYDPAADLDAPIGLAPGEWNMLNETRLLSLVEKVRAGRFAEIATNVLATELGEVVPLETGFSNGSGIIQSFVTDSAGRRVGWQIQGGTLRLAVITEEQDRRYLAKQVALVADLYEQYFVFTLPDYLAQLLGPYTGRKLWHSFAPSFVYQHRPLAPGTTWNDLLALIEWFSRHTLAYVAEHRIEQ